MKLASILFLISGAAALVYQVSWQRILGTYSGVHTYSITLIVTAFMAGLGTGSLLGGKFADRMPRRMSVLAFAACETAIGLFALISAWLYYDVAHLYLGFLIRYTFALPLVHFLLLLFPTLLMGASLPLLSRGLVLESENAARTIGILYGVNTLGAALGAFAAVWFAIGAFGFEGTIQIAAVLNFAAAAGAVSIFRGMFGAERKPAVTQSATSVPPQGDGADLGLWSWAGIYSLSGFIALSFELLWFRILDVSIKSSPYTFGHLLGTFLFFLAIGSLVGAVTVKYSRRPDQVFLWGQWGIAVSAGLALVVLCHLPAESWPLRDLFEYWNRDDGLPLYELLGATSVRTSAVASLALQVYVALPIALLALPTLLMGWTFAFIQATVQTDIREVGWRVALIQTANIVGSILGSSLTGALMLNVLGTPATVKFLILLAPIFGCLAVARSRFSNRSFAAVAVVGISLLLFSAVPDRDTFWARFHGSKIDHVIVSEDASSVIVLQRIAENVALLRVNGTGHSILPYGGAHTIMGVVPVLAHSKAKDALIIGLGVGNTAWAVGASPSIERIDVYEIARPEFDVMSRYRSRWFPAPSIDALHRDPRMRFIFSDGRLALRLENRKYDLILVDAPDPNIAYAGNLYSREFFEEARNGLAPGGLFCSYAPTERIRRTVVRVFPHVVSIHMPGFLHFMLGASERIDVTRGDLLKRLRNVKVRDYLSSTTLGESSYLEVRKLLRGARVTTIGPDDSDPRWRGDVNTDLFPRDEFDMTTVDQR